MIVSKWDVVMEALEYMDRPPEAWRCQKQLVRAQSVWGAPNKHRPQRASHCVFIRCSSASSHPMAHPSLLLFDRWVSLWYSSCIQAWRRLDRSQTQGTRLQSTPCSHQVPPHVTRGFWACQRTFFFFSFAPVAKSCWWECRVTNDSRRLTVMWCAQVCQLSGAGWAIWWGPSAVSCLSSLRIHVCQMTKHWCFCSRVVL